MIVYGHHTFSLDLPHFLSVFSRRLDRTRVGPTRDSVVDLFVDFGEAYAAFADAMLPDVDDEHRGLHGWSAAMQALADAVCALVHQDADRTRRALDELAPAVSELARTASASPIVRAAAAEGFAYYALLPDQYVVAADRFLSSMRPTMLTCVGLRGIGAPLAHVVAAAARRARVDCLVLTARPRGHPFDRHLQLSGALRTRIAQRSHGHAAVVDEGPGLSGSSFAAGVEQLVDAGFPRERIGLFPSWRAPGARLRSARGQCTFEQQAQFVVDIDEVCPHDDWEDLSAGQWRRTVFGSEERTWPAAHPQHERRKYRSRDRRQLRRFVGLGRHGRQLVARAEALADGGFTAAPLWSHGGFLQQEWTDGEPISVNAPAGDAWLERISAYIAFVAKAFPTGRRAAVDDLLEMVRINCREANIEDGVVHLDRLGFARHFDEPEVAVDGRLLPQEWLVAGDQYVKTDALDHHADDFLPGGRDIAWDVAGAVVELQLDADRMTSLIDRCARRLADRTLERRLEFYIPAYTAYRLGYATLAAESLGRTADGMRFRCLRRRYRRSLEARARR